MSAVVFSLRPMCPVDRLQWLPRCRPVTSQLTIGDVIICRCVRVWPIHVHARLYNYLRQGGYVLAVVCLSVCLIVSNFAQKLPNGFAWNFQGRLAMGQRLNFGDDPRIRDPDTDPYRDTGKTCPGWGMHRPSASSCNMRWLMSQITRLYAFDSFVCWWKVNFCIALSQNNYFSTSRGRWKCGTEKQDWKIAI